MHASDLQLVLLSIQSRSPESITKSCPCLNDEQSPEARFDLKGAARAVMLPD